MHTKEHQRTNLVGCCLAWPCDVAVDLHDFNAIRCFKTKVHVQAICHFKLEKLEKLDKYPKKPKFILKILSPLFPQLLGSGPC